MVLIVSSTGRARSSGTPTGQHGRSIWVVTLTRQQHIRHSMVLVRTAHAAEWTSRQQQREPEAVSGPFISIRERDGLYIEAGF